MAFDIRTCWESTCSQLQVFTRQRCASAIPSLLPMESREKWNERLNLSWRFMDLQFSRMFVTKRYANRNASDIFGHIHCVIADDEVFLASFCRQDQLLNFEWHRKSLPKFSRTLRFAWNPSGAEYRPHRCLTSSIRRDPDDGAIANTWYRSHSITLGSTPPERSSYEASTSTEVSTVDIKRLQIYPGRSGRVSFCSGISMADIRCKKKRWGKAFFCLLEFCWNEFPTDKRSFWYEGKLGQPVTY